MSAILSHYDKMACYKLTSTPSKPYTSPIYSDLPFCHVMSGCHVPKPTLQLSNLYAIFVYSSHHLAILLFPALYAIIKSLFCWVIPPALPFSLVGFLPLLTHCHITTYTVMHYISKYIGFLRPISPPASLMPTPQYTITPCLIYCYGPYHSWHSPCFSSY